MAQRPLFAVLALAYFFGNVGGFIVYVVHHEAGVLLLSLGVVAHLVGFVWFRLRLHALCDAYRQKWVA